MSGTENRPPFNDPQHPGWYPDPNAGRAVPQPPPLPEAATPYSYQPGPGAQPYTGQQPYGGPDYNQPMYYTPQAQPKGLSIAALVLGIVSVVTFGFMLVPQVLAIVFGHIALGKEPAGRSMALAGLIMGYAVTGIWCLLLFIGILAGA